MKPATIDRSPDVERERGCAWRSRCDFSAARAHLGTWLLYCPGAHPVWSFYLVSAITLRDFEGMEPSVRHYPGATHEVLVVALDPASSPRPEDRLSWRGLAPPNLAAQFTCRADAVAIRTTDFVVSAFCDGRLSPDSDFRAWTTETVRATARCVDAGHHVES